MTRWRVKLWFSCQYCDEYPFVEAETRKEAIEVILREEELDYPQGQSGRIYSKITATKEGRNNHE